MDDFLKTIIYIIVVIFVAYLISAFINGCERDIELHGGGGPRYVENVTIYSIQQMETRGQKNGRDIFHNAPTVHHIVTNKGTYEINSEGPHKFDNAIPYIHVGDTLPCIKIEGSEPGPFSSTYPSITRIWLTDRAWEKYKSEAKGPLYIVKKGTTQNLPELGRFFVYKKNYIIKNITYNPIKFSKIVFKNLHF